MGTTRKIIKDHYLQLAITLIAVVCFFAIILPLQVKKVIDYDSSYQIFLIRHTWSDMWNLILQDFSPPLYSIYIKLFSIFNSDAQTLWLSTFVIYIGVVLGCLFPLKRAYGQTVSSLIALCFVFSPVNFFIFDQLRPHSLGYLLVTIAFIYAVLILQKQEKNDYIKFTIFAVLAMYTHNVALLSIFAFYLVLFFTFIYRKAYKEIRRLLISGIIAIFLYIPWLIVLFKQLGQVNRNYWHDTIYYKELFLDVIMRPFSAYSEASTILLSILLLFIVAGLLLIIKEKRNLNINLSQEVSTLMLFIMSIIIYVIVIGYIVKSPAPRYTYQFTGMSLILICNYLFMFWENHKSFWPFVLILIIINFAGYAINYNQKLNNNNFLEMVEEIKSRNGDDVAFVHSGEWSLGIMFYYFPDARVYVTQDTYTVLVTYDVFSKDIVVMDSPDDILNYEDDFYVFAPDYGETWGAFSYYANSDQYTYERCPKVFTGTFFNNDAAYAYVHK